MSDDLKQLRERRARPRVSEARWRSPLIARSEAGMVHPRDLYLTGELSDLWGIHHDHVCQAARELGESATIEAVYARAVDLRADSENNGRP